MSPGPTPRQQAREQSLVRIKELALTQLAEHGAEGLSLRRIARELKLVSSAIYRYFPSRDALVTALVVDAYTDLAATVGESGATGRGRTPRRRWLDGCRAVRAWALAQPHRFSLVYGSAIPGYRAPQDTVAPASAVLVALLDPAARTGLPGAGEGAGGGEDARLPVGLSHQLGDVADLTLPGTDPHQLLLLLGSFARLVGLLTLELNGHLVGAFEPADELFEALLAREADDLGL